MTNKRTPLSKKTRFDIFKRDLFRCQYCGATPTSVVLEIDHIQPVSKGGGNNQANLLTGCFDCNRGKGAGLLTSIPESVRAFLKHLPSHELVEYMQLACIRVENAEAALKYFCRFYWGTIKDKRHGQS